MTFGKALGLEYKRSSKLVVYRFHSICRNDSLSYEGFVLGRR